MIYKRAVGLPDTALNLTAAERIIFSTGCSCTGAAGFVLRDILGEHCAQEVISSEFHPPTRT